MSPAKALRRCTRHWSSQRADPTKVGGVWLFACAASSVVSVNAKQAWARREDFRFMACGLREATLRRWDGLSIQELAAGVTETGAQYLECGDLSPLSLPERLVA